MGDKTFDTFQVSRSKFSWRSGRFIERRPTNLTLYCIVNRLKTEMWPTFSYLTKRLTKYILKSPKYCSLKGNEGQEIECWCQNVHHKLLHSRFCTCRVNILSKLPECCRTAKISILLHETTFNRSCNLNVH